MAAKKKSDVSQSVVATSAATVVLEKLEDKIVDIDIVGTAPLIPHQWSEKAKKMMPGHPDKPDVKPKLGKRNPKEEAEACVYRLPDGTPGMPATAFKSAIVGACRFFSKPSMTEARLWFFVEGQGPQQLVPIKGKPRMREDVARNANGNADLRYRYEFLDWTATLRVRFMTLTTPESVAALVDAAGRCGVGDWRPASKESYSGTFGTWRVKELSK